MEAQSQEHAAKLIHQKGYIIINISPRRTLSLGAISSFKSRVTMGDVTNFTRQLATMISSGLPLTEALLILRSQSKANMQTIVSQVLADVEEGSSLSKALSKHPNAFSKTFIALIKSGEVGGVMDKVLVSLSDDLEKQQEFRGKVKGALIYPVIIVLGMVIVALIMFIFVIPRLTSLYDQFDVDLPIATKMVMAVSNLMVKFWPLLIIGLAGAVYGFNLYRKTEVGRRKTDELIFKIPIIGDLQRQVVLTDLTRTLSLMTASGVSILEGLEISSQVVKNTVIAEALEDIKVMVEKGLCFFSPS